MMEKKPKLFDTRRSLALFLALMALQMLLLCQWNARRENLYVDELYSLQYAHYETDAKNSIVYLEKLEDFGENCWVSGDALRETLITDTGESVLALSLAAAWKLLLKRKNYFFLLNLLNSSFSPETLSTVPGFGLNLCLFPLLQLVLFSTIKRMTQKDAAGLFATAVYGFSCFMIDQTLFIRFYQWTVLLVALALLLHAKLWEREDWKTGRFFLCECAALGLFYLAFRNSELVCVFGAAFLGLFLAALLLRGRKKQAMLYCLPVAAGVVGFLVKEKTLVNLLLHPEQYVGGSSYAKDLVAGALLSLSPGSFLRNLLRLCKHVGRLLFFSPWMLLAAAALLGGLLLLAVRARRGGERKPLLKNRGFLAVLAGTVLLYELLLAMASCTTARYSAFGVYGLVIIVSCIGSAAVERNGNKAGRVLICLWLAVYAVLPFTNPASVSLLYAGEAEVLIKAEAYPAADVLLVTDRRHTLYDALYNAGEGKRLLRTDPAAEIYDGPTDFGPELLVWCEDEAEFGESRLLGEILPELGYRFELLGRTHCSAIYYGYKE